MNVSASFIKLKDLVISNTPLNSEMYHASEKPHHNRNKYNCYVYHIQKHYNTIFSICNKTTHQTIKFNTVFFYRNCMSSVFQYRNYFKKTFISIKKHERLKYWRLWQSQKKDNLGVCLMSGISLSRHSVLRSGVLRLLFLRSQFKTGSQAAMCHILTLVCKISV